MLYEVLNAFAVAAYIFRKAIYAEKLLCVSQDKFAVDSSVVIQELRTAFFACLVVAHQTFTTLARNMQQSWDSISVIYLSVKVPVMEWL